MKCNIIINYYHLIIVLIHIAVHAEDYLRHDRHPLLGKITICVIYLCNFCK